MRRKDHFTKASVMTRVFGSKETHRLPVDLPCEDGARLGVRRRAVQVDSLPDVEHWRLEEGPCVNLHELGSHWTQQRRDREKYHDTNDSPQIRRFDIKL